MKIKITPQRRRLDNAETCTVDVRITLSMEAKSKADKRELNKVWDALEGDDSVETLLDLIAKMNKKKG